MDLGPSSHRGQLQPEPAPEPAGPPALRPYQLEAVERASAAIARARNPVIVLPTGAGKSLVLAELASGNAHLRPLILAHRQELVAQDAAAVERLTGRAPAVVCTGLARNDAVEHAPIVVGSVQTIARRDVSARRLLIVDEAHLVPPEAGSQYQTVIGRHADAAIIGLSATPYRLDDGPIVDHPNIPFDEITTFVPAADLVEQGFLAPLVLDDRRRHAIRSDGVRLRGGEFAVNELEKAAAVAELVELQMADAADAAAGRRSILVFTVGKQHADMVGSTLTDRGEHAAVVTEDTPAREREATLAAFKAGELRWLVNVDVLTTGFDAPNIDTIVCLRPTQSKGLFVQMVGRGYRIAPGKTDCLLLDYAGNIARHPDLDELAGRQLVDGEPPPTPPVQTASSSTWHDRALDTDTTPAGPDGVADLGVHRVVFLHTVVQPSRSAPGTQHVLVSARLWSPDRGTWSLRSWCVPEHRNRFARYRSLQLARRCGWTAPSITAAQLAELLRLARPARVRVWQQQTPRGTFHRLDIVDP